MLNGILLGLKDPVGFADLETYRVLKTQQVFLKFLKII